MKSLSCAAALLVSGFLPQNADAAQLVMVEQTGCHYCTQWKEEIGPIYPKTEAGQFAPLQMIDISERDPDAFDYARRVNFTPTFVLVDEGGTELARIEGYPGEDFFWGLLEKMLRDNTEFEGGQPCNVC